MAERKETDHIKLKRPGGYAQPKGATQVQRDAAQKIIAVNKCDSRISLPGDQLAPYEPVVQVSNSVVVKEILQPDYSLDDPATEIYIGDCRDVLARLSKVEHIGGKVDLVYADPPFNWDVPYDEWSDGMPREEYERFTFDWLDGCINILKPTGSLWVNIPDDTAAEIVMHLKRRGLTMINWCIWHFRFGQCRDSSFIMSKVHVLYFARNPVERTWNPQDILEQSDRAAIYNDKRTQAKETNKGMRVPMDVWYGKHWGRIQGNNKERRHQHHNQIPEVYLERVIRACTNEGDLVLDPFLGSGTTCTVARELDRRSIGIEYGKANAVSAFERIQAGTIRVKKDTPTIQSSAIFDKRGETHTDKIKREHNPLFFSD